MSKKYIKSTKPKKRQRLPVEGDETKLSAYQLSRYGRYVAKMIEADGNREALLDGSYCYQRTRQKGAE